ncbi:lachesin-like isoform X2 [Varroa jacobsoni]|uniref:Ig-like domain-containing protein n=1 Tax=Varroa destructor TaxID=109461 RepID=A0A7M7KPD7_VARDE|nr:lachesin-like isoform X1 [Varroa destructor]XP_022696523.1 lachesin-like isoform X2 [Varroa jacobsoni]
MRLLMTKRTPRSQTSPSVQTSTTTCSLWLMLLLCSVTALAEIGGGRILRKGGGYNQGLSGHGHQSVGNDAGDYTEDGEVIPQFAEPVQNITVPRGRDAKIACIIDNLGDFRPAWIKEEDKAILTMHQQIISRNYRISLSTSDNRIFTLHIRNVQESDRGGYMCQINTSPVKSSTGYLDVLVPPDILVEQSSADVVVREGADVSLACKARGYPTPSISWRREDGEPIPLGAYKQLTQQQQAANNKLHTLVHSYTGETLTIARVSRIHMGAYLCIANNNVPSPVSRRIMLHVHFSPVIWIPQQLVGVAPRHNVSLDCHSEAYPLATIHWSKDGSRLTGSTETTRSTGRQSAFQTLAQGANTPAGGKYLIEAKRTSSYKIRSVLTIRDTQPSDYGFYKCVSENILGFTESSAQIYEVSPARSSSTQESMVEDDEEDDEPPYGMGTPEKSYSDGKYFSEEVLRPKELTNKASGALRSMSSWNLVTLPWILLLLLRCLS